MDDNLEQYNKHYGFLNNNERCYFAPERWRSPPTTREQFKKENERADLQKPMDIFSLGCVIAEILFMDAAPLFNLVKLNDLRKGSFDTKRALEDSALKDDPVIVDLILKMVEADPKKRPTIDVCLREWLQ